MTDYDILNVIEGNIDVDRLQCATASVKINCKLGNISKKLYRFSEGPWKPTLREAIAAYHERWTRTAYGEIPTVK